MTASRWMVLPLVFGIATAGVGCTVNEPEVEEEPMMEEQPMDNEAVEPMEEGEAMEETE